MNVLYYFVLRARIAVGIVMATCWTTKYIQDVLGYILFHPENWQYPLLLEALPHPACYPPPQFINLCCLFHLFIFSTHLFFPLMASESADYAFPRLLSTSYQFTHTLFLFISFLSKNNTFKDHFFLMFSLLLLVQSRPRSQYALCL